MDAGASMELEYVHGSQSHQPPILAFGLDPPRSGSRCPAIGNWGAAARPDWPGYHRPWNPHSHVPGGLTSENRPYAPPQWPLHGPAGHTGEPPARSPEAGHSQDAGLRPPTTAHAYYTQLASTAGPGLTPPETASVESPVSAPSSDPMPAHGGQSPSAQDPPAGASGGPPFSPSANYTPQLNGDAPAWRRVPDSPPSSFVRVRLPAPSDHRTRHRAPSHQADRGAIPGGPLGGGSAAVRGTAATSPIPSPDEDSDPGTNPRHLPMMAYLHSTRQSQILRGQMSNKRVASKKAIQSLQEVDMDSLPENEKTCVICYNDFGVASPEGTVETPLRLPKCKHVFGNKCILKWLEGSFSCPYCRDKLDSELARPSETVIRRMFEAARGDADLLAQSPTFRRMMAMNHGREPGHVSDRPHAASRRHRDHETTREGATRGERRGAPFMDASDVERRIRPRHETFHISRTATFESHHDALSRHSPPSTAMQQPQSPGNQPSSYRPPPVWQPGRRIESQPLFLAPSMAPSPGYMLHVPAGAQQPSAPPSHASSFAPLPPPIAMPPSNPMPPFLPAVSSTQNYQAPSMMPNGDFYSGGYMPGYGGLASTAASGPESTYASIPPAQPSSQLPGFPDFLNQLPREITFHTEFHSTTRPAPN